MWAMPIWLFVTINITLDIREEIPELSFVFTTLAVIWLIVLLLTVLIFIFHLLI